MTLGRQQKIDKAANICKAIFAYSFVINLCLFLLIRFIIVILNKLGIDITTMSGYTEIASVYEICCLFVVVITIAALLSIIILSFWTTDEEKEQRKEEIKEAVREIKDEEKAINKVKAAIQKEVESPLKGLTDQQIQVVLNVLFDIPVNDKGFIANAELMGLIHALESDDNLKKNVALEDVIAWVEYIRFPDKVDAAHFKSEYSYRPSPSTITKMGNRIRKGFDKLANLR